MPDGIPTSGREITSQGEKPPRQPGEQLEDYQRRVARWRLEQFGYDVGGLYEAPAATPGQPLGQPIMPNPDDYWWKVNEFGETVPADPGEPGAWQDVSSYNSDFMDYQKYAQYGAAGPGGGYSGPTAEELAIERSKVHAQNMATWLDSVIAGVEADMDARRLTTEQATAEFNRRLDAFAEAGGLYEGIQPSTIPAGVRHVPGFEPGGLATQLGLQPWKATPTMYDPFAMAADIVATTPEITGIGAPETGALQQAIDVARRFV